MQGGEKKSVGESKSLIELNASNVFAHFYDVDEVEFSLSIGRTRTMPIALQLAESETLNTEGVQTDSDGIIAFNKNGKKCISLIEAKETYQRIWWRQLYFPYWDRIARHPDLDVHLTIVLRNEEENDQWYVYCAKFLSKSPASCQIIHSVAVHLT